MRRDCDLGVRRDRRLLRSDIHSGKRFAQAVRGHWGIENALHRVHDVTLYEDQSRTRKRYVVDNFSWLCCLAISLLEHTRHLTGAGPASTAPRGEANRCLIETGKRLTLCETDQ